MGSRISNKHLCGGLLLVASAWMAGCGTQSVMNPIKNVTGAVANRAKSVTGALTKNFQSEDREVTPTTADGRTVASLSSDSYDSTPAGWREENKSPARRDRTSLASLPEEKTERGPDSQVLGYDHGQRDGAPVDNVIEAQIQKLREKEREEYRRLSEYEAKVREYSELKAELARRSETTQRQIQQYENVLRLAESNPDALQRDPYEGAKFGQKPVDGWRGASDPNPAAPADGSAAAPGSWRQSDRPLPPEVERPASAVGPRSSGPAPASAAQDEQLSPAERLSGMAGPPGMKSPVAPAVRKAPQAGPETKTSAGIATTILAADGSGAETAVIIGAGTRNGVSEGMMFQKSSPTGEKAVLVVTETYPTYSRAVLHPKYASSRVRLRDRVTQVASNPVTPGP